MLLGIRHETLEDLIARPVLGYQVKEGVTLRRGIFRMTADIEVEA
jgi:hypothetical protein